jgi:hypothetical protein
MLGLDFMIGHRDLNILLQPLISNKFYSYKCVAPTLQQHVPKLIQLSPIEAAGKNLQSQSNI